MSLFTPLPEPCRQRRPQPQRACAALAGVAAALLLWGCSAPPVALPRLPPPTRAEPVAAAPGAPSAAASAPSSVSAQASAQAPMPAVLAVPPLPPVPLPPAAAQAEPAAPYGPAVAARFPEPGVSYDTPAFEPGRADFTSNTELQTLLRRLVSDGGPAGPQVRLLPLGPSQRGVPIEALLFTRHADSAPAALLRAGRPTVLLVGQQHGNEPAGAEALMVLARELAQGRLVGLLDRINVLILPRANPDGAQAQQRVTASGIDANRDHLLLKTPEAQAQAQLVRDYRPAVVVDAHEYTVVGRYLEKFGSVQRFDALVQYATTANLPEFITRAAEEWFRRPMLASLAQQGLTAEWYYTTSTDLADKRISMGGTQPDTGRNVNGLKNAVSLLIETRGVGIGRLHLARRVHTHVVAMSSFLASAAQRADDLIKLRQYVDNEVSALACQGEAIVEAAPTPSEYALTMLDPATGADKTIGVNWESSLQLRTLKARARPCGYWLAADEADAVRRLRGLGVIVQQIDSKGVVRGETYSELSREVGVRQDVRGSIADGEGTLQVQVATVPALLDVSPGSWYVPLDQPLANLVMAALEPDTQNSYLSNRILGSLAAGARVLARPQMRMSLVP